MGAKRYFGRQFQINKLGFEHEEASDFFLCCWQKNRSPLPLLCVRLLVFLGCTAIMLSSMSLTGMSISFGFWFIYMTHWGLGLITVASGLGFVVSARAFFLGPIDSTFGLPWYVKLYWVAYDITVPVAFYITAFYYILLTDMGEEFSVDPVLDVFIHGINSVMMFVLLMTSQQPSHLLHVLYPVGFTLIYLVFSIIYYFAGGVSPFGTSWIYPMIDWANPGPTTGVVFGAAAALIFMHIVVVLLSLLRDYLSKRYVRNENSLSLSR